MLIKLCLCGESECWSHCLTFSVCVWGWVVDADLVV